MRRSGFIAWVHLPRSVKSVTGVTHRTLVRSYRPVLEITTRPARMHGGESGGTRPSGDPAAARPPTRRQRKRGTPICDVALKRGAGAWRLLLRCPALAALTITTADSTGAEEADGGPQMKTEQAHRQLRRQRELRGRFPGCSPPAGRDPHAAAGGGDVEAEDGDAHGRARGASPSASARRSAPPGGPSSRRSTPATARSRPRLLRPTARPAARWSTVRSVTKATVSSAATSSAAGR